MLSLIQQTGLLAVSLWYETQGISLTVIQPYTTEFSHLHSFNQNIFHCSQGEFVQVTAFKLTMLVFLG